MDANNKYAGCVPKLANSTRREFHFPVNQDKQFVQGQTAIYLYVHLQDGM